MNDLKEIFGSDLKDLVGDSTRSKTENSPLQRPLENGLPEDTNEGVSNGESVTAVENTNSGEVKEENPRSPVADESMPVCGSSSVTIRPQQQEDSVSAQHKKQVEMPFGKCLA